MMKKRRKKKRSVSVVSAARYESAGRSISGCVVPLLYAGRGGAQIYVRLRAEKETFSFAITHGGHVAASSAHGSPPPLMYSPALIPEEGSPRPFCLHHTCKDEVQAGVQPSLSASRTRFALSYLSRGWEASFNSARTGSAAFTRARERACDREPHRDDFQLTPLFLRWFYGCLLCLA